MTPGNLKLTLAGLSFLFCLPFLSFGQIIKWEFEVVEMPEGSLGNRVSCIAQDSLGYLWFSSAKGLHRYDGQQFKTFLHHPNDTTTLTDNYISEVYVDHKGVVYAGTQTGGFHRYHPEKENFTRIPLTTPNSSPSFNNWIHGIREDTTGHLWVGTMEGGVFRLDENRQLIRHYLHQADDSHSLTFNSIADIVLDKNGVIWVCTGWYPLGRYNGGLNRYEPEIDGFTRFMHEPNDPNSLEENVVWTAYEDRHNNFWVGTSGDGLHLMDRKKGRFEHLYYAPQNPQQLSEPRSDYPLMGMAENAGVRRIIEDRSGNLWVISFDDGLVIYQAETEKVFRYQNAHEEADYQEDAIPSKSLWNIAVAKDGTVWLAGGRPGKVLKAKPVYQAFQYTDLKHLVTSHDLSAIAEDRQGNIWIGTYGFGLLCYDRTNNSIQRFTSDEENPNSISGNTIWSIYEDKMGYVWVGTFNTGLNRYDPKNKVFKRFTYDKNDPGSLSDIYINFIQEDANENVWIGTDANGLNVFQPETETFKRFIPGTSQAVSGSGIKNLFLDSKDRFWALGGESLINLGTLEGSGFIDLWDTDQQEWQPVLSGKQNNISGKAAIAMAEDKAGYLWFIAEEGGLHRFNPEDQSIKFFNPQVGNFPEWDTRWLIADANGTLWIGSGQRIYHFYPQEEQWTQYDVFAKHSGSIITNNVIINDSGELIFNWGSGFYIFHPEQYEEVAKAQVVPELLFSHLEISSPDTNALLRQSLYQKEEIELTYQQNTFNIGIRNFHYLEPQSNRVEFLLEPYVNRWRVLPENQLAEYLAVPPGSYILRARGFSSEGLQSQEKTLSIIIHPPWWQTNWAYAIYTLTTLLLLLGLYLYQRRRWQLQTQLQVEQEKANRLSELDSFKSRFYTNITHEFRTPLTVIQGMAGQIQEDQKIKNLIQRNADRLLNMVNQLLDLSKLESNSLTIDWGQGDVIPYLQYLTESCHSLAENKQLNLAFFSKEDKLIMDFDENKLQQILINLVSNAIKFTPEYGSVKVVASRTSDQATDCLQLTVEDTGRGIPAEKLPQIFNRFYQVDASATRKGEGSGIGLALVQELVHLLEGRIEVESEVDKGSKFMVFLPIHREATLATTSFSTPAKAMPTTTIGADMSAMAEPAINGEKSLVLVIEDNADVVEYIFSCLQQDYNLASARNGKAGLEKALEIIPDVILCDVMMPEMDGFEVCQHLKNSTPTSHIPVILLTAKATQEDKLTGLSHGADAYLTKPFDKAELLLRLNNLTQLSKRLQEHLTTSALSNSQASQLEEREAAFLREIHQIIDNKMADEDFNTHQLCRAIAMSRTQLHRKLKALTGQATANYIRSIRLQKAKLLLTDTDLPIGDIASRVGFKDFSHFSKSFLKEFGVQPSGLRQK